jgi:hypothetical protein
LIPAVKRSRNRLEYLRNLGGKLLAHDGKRKAACKYCDAAHLMQALLLNQFL